MPLRDVGVVDSRVAGRTRLCSHVNVSDAIEDSSPEFLLNGAMRVRFNLEQWPSRIRPNYQPVVERPMRGGLLCSEQCFFSQSWHQLRLLSRRDGKRNGTKRLRRRKKRGELLPQADQTL